jgi:hypothetical protein
LSILIVADLLLMFAKINANVDLYVAIDVSSLINNIYGRNFFSLEGRSRKIDTSDYIILLETTNVYANKNTLVSTIMSSLMPYYQHQP